MTAALASRVIDAYLPACMINAAMRFVAHPFVTNVMCYLHIYSKHGIITVESTDSYRLVRLSTKPCAGEDDDDCSASDDFDSIIDLGLIPNINGQEAHLHVAGGTGWVNTEDEFGCSTIRFNIVDKTAEMGGKFPDFDKLFPDSDSEYGSYVNVGISPVYLGYICDSANDIHAERLVMRGTAFNKKSNDDGPILFEAEGHDVTMRALIMPQRVGKRRAYVVRDGDAR